MDLTAEMAVQNPFDFFLEPYAQQFPFKYEAIEARELAPFLLPGPATPLFAQYLDGIPRTPRATIDFLVELNGRLAADVRYVIRMEPGVQPPEETLAEALRLLPRLGRTAGPTAAASGTRRALRVGLSHSTGGRHETRRGPRRSEP